MGKGVSGSRVTRVFVEKMELTSRRILLMTVIEISLEIEELESKIAPTQPPGQLGYEGNPGNQGGGNHHP